MEAFRGYFENIDDAMHRLLLEIGAIDLSNTIIVGIFREEALLAKKIAQHSGLPLEFLLITAIKAPENNECCIAFVSEMMDVVMDEGLIEAFGITNDCVFEMANRVYEDVLYPWGRKIRGESKMQSFEGKDILIVDESVEIGFGAELAIRACVKSGCKSIALATPVLSCDLYSFLLKQCDQIHCILSPEYFVSTPYYYKDSLSIDGEFLSPNKARF